MYAQLKIIAFALSTFVALSACGRTSSPSTSALVARWTFDSDKGATAQDTSGKGNTGALRNAGWGPGKIGQALQMNGGNDSIMTVPLSDSLRSTAAEITVMAWAYRTAEHNVAVFAHGYPTLFLGFHGPQFKWQVVNEHDKGARCYADPKYQARLNQWFHLVGTYDGRTARLYVDGKKICSKWLWRGGALQMPDVPFTVSGYLDENGKIVDEITGLIDEVRVYNRALDAEEIENIYAAENNIHR